MKHYQKLDLHIVQGAFAPVYTNTTELVLECVNVTEQGTEAHLPIVDFKMKSPQGEEFVLVLTGRMVNMISSAIKGVNLRIHGKEEP